ncbi:MAG TPA: hypothetical protein PKN64_09100, partial [Casimicrobium sp.]|nr:hypothetical protein [Casimicrobium sp.]
MTLRLLRNLPFFSTSIAAVAWAALLGVTLVCYYNATLNHFFDFGGSTDASWFAGMMWRTNINLPRPLFLGSFQQTYYGAHFSPLLTLPMAISWLLPKVAMVPFYAATIGVFHALTTAVFGWISFSAMRSLNFPFAAKHASALLLTALFGFGAMQASHAGLPHFEIVYVGFLLLFFYLFLQRRFRWAAAALFGAFLIREDAGLIVSFFLLPYILWQRYHWHRVRTSLLFLAAGLLTTAFLLFFLIPQVFHGYGLFRDTYIGTPPFAHLTLQHIEERSAFFFLRNNHIWLALLAMLGMAAWFRQSVLALGAVGALPWVLIHTYLCTHYTGGTLSYYYNFPVLIALAWPLLAIAGGQASFTHPTQRLRGLLFTLAVLALACTAPLHDVAKGQLVRPYKFFSFEPRYGLQTVAAYESFFGAFAADRSQYGVVWASLHAASQSPANFRRLEWLFDLRDGSPEVREKLLHADTVIVFEREFSCPEFAALDRTKYVAYRVTGTKLKILRRADLSMPSRAVPFLEPADAT